MDGNPEEGMFYHKNEASYAHGTVASKEASCLHVREVAEPQTQHARQCRCVNTLRGFKSPRVNFFLGGGGLLFLNTNNVR